MLVLLLLAALCLGTGAHDNIMTVQELKNILEEMLYAPKPDKLTYAGYPRNPTSKYPESVSTESSSDGYPREGSTTESVSVSYPESSSPSPNEHYDPSEELEHKYPIQVGSIRGIPGINFPDYTDIPLTSFICSDKTYTPGFYADMETGCQVFHVCWPHRRESFLCPVGTIFNQAILACDYWYSSNCSLASHYYDVNADSLTDGGDKKDAHVGSMVDSLLEKDVSQIQRSEGSSEGVSQTRHVVDMSYILKFLPVKAKVVVYPETAKSRAKIIAEASVGKIEQPKALTEDELKLKHFEVAKPKYTSFQTQTADPARPQKVTVKPTVTASNAKPENVHDTNDKFDRSDRYWYILKNVAREAEGIISGSTAAKIARTVTLPPDSFDPVAIFYRILYFVKKILREYEEMPPGSTVSSGIPSEINLEYPRGSIDPKVEQIIDHVLAFYKSHTWKTSRPSTDHIYRNDPWAKQIIGQILDILRKLLKEAENYYPPMTDAQKPAPVVEKQIPTEKSTHATTVPPAVTSPVKTEKYSPLVKLNPRFIVKPVNVPKLESVKPKPMVAQPPVKMPEIQRSKSVKTIKPMLLHPKTSHKYSLRVSPSTKQALTANYLKMLKLKLG